MQKQPESKQSIFGWDRPLVSNAVLPLSLENHLSFRKYLGV